MLLNDFAYRCFRDIADQDYIAARLAYHHYLPEPSLWQSQQAIEKYLKCILLLHRIPATKVFHNLAEALTLTQQITDPAINLTSATNDFISHIDVYGTDRYLTNSSVSLAKMSLGWIALFGNSEDFAH
jgi:HEPN domain-containing protein